MKSNLVSLGSGLLFGIGLAVSGMVKPSKVIGFLDVAGAWDPSLMLVMAGAVFVHTIFFRLVASKRNTPFFDTTFHLPTRKEIDSRLVFGAVIFGVGWGLGGFCPGPGLVSAASGSTAAIVFTGGMTLGIVVEHLASQRAARARSEGSRNSGSRA